MAKKVVLAGACRTAIGTMGGELSTVPAPELGAIVIKEALKRAGVAPEAVDQVYMGCVIQAGQGQNVARQATLKAGLPIEVPAVTINVVCGSGLEAVNMAAEMILSGDADIVVAGGMENMSMAPYAMMKGRYGYRMGNATLVDTMVNDALWDAFNNYHMGITAENICDQWGLTREELDKFAAVSQQKAEAAQKSGAFKDEIVPVEVKKKKETVIVDTETTVHLLLIPRSRPSQAAPVRQTRTLIRMTVLTRETEKKTERRKHQRQERELSSCHSLRKKRLRLRMLRPLPFQSA